MDRVWPRKRRQDYECSPNLSWPKQIADFGLHWALMRWVAAGELSHAWHYKSHPINDEIKKYMHYVEGDSNATVSAGDLFGVARGHLYGWPRGREIKPRDYSLETGSFWHYVFWDGYGDKYKECIINLRGPAIIKVGPESFYAGLVNDKGYPIRSTLSNSLVEVHDKSIIWPRI